MIALSDYTTDQRGDVGSWIRAEVLTGLGATMSEVARDIEKEALDRVPQHLFEDVIRGIAKQAVEKLEPVRCAAALALASLRQANARAIWSWEGVEALRFSPIGEM